MDARCPKATTTVSHHRNYSLVKANTLLVVFILWPCGFLCYKSHYRSTLDLTNDGLIAAVKGFCRLCDAKNILDSLESAVAQKGAKDELIMEVLDQVIEEMCDDFNTPKALAKLFELVPIINAYAEGKLPAEDISAETLKELKARFDVIFSDIFGLYNPTESGGKAAEALDSVMNLVLDIRNDARSNKNWTTSDKIRDGLATAGVVVKDGKDGTNWKL